MKLPLGTTRRATTDRIGRLCRCVLLAPALLVGGCSAAQPSAGEGRVCRSVQGLVADLEGDRPRAAIERLTELHSAVLDSDNERLTSAGNMFFDELVTDIDYTQLTFDQTVQLGQQYQAVLGDLMGEMIDECDSAGISIRMEVRG